MGKRIICGCVVLGIVACLIGCQKSDNYELMKESKQQVLPIYEKKDAEVQGEKCALETLQDVYKSDYILEEWKIEKIGEPGGIFCNDEAVLISDKKTDCIFEVDYAGNILKEVGGTGSGEGEFISPSAITMCNEKIYVLDQGNNRIQVLDKELDYIEEIKLKNTQSTDPNYIPEVLSVNQESIYVTGVSLENPVVDKYTDGKLKEIGSNFIGSIYSCNNQIYLINSMVKNALYTKIQWRIVRGMCALVAILFFMINETIVLMAKAKKERKIMGINLALGATERDIKYCLFFETLLVTLLAVFLVMITLRPLAKLASLEHIIILDSMGIVETVILAVWACEILTWIIVSRIKKENIADMVRTTRDI